MEIILLRHEKTKIPSTDKMPADDFAKWVSLYNESEISLSSIPTEESVQICKSSKFNVCSELARSIQSATALKIAHINISSS